MLYAISRLICAVLRHKPNDLGPLSNVRSVIACSRCQSCLAREPYIVEEGYPGVRFGK